MIISRHTIPHKEAEKLTENLALKAGQEPFWVDDSEVVVDAYIENNLNCYRIFALPDKNPNGSPKRRTLLLVAHISPKPDLDYELQIEVGNLGIFSLLGGVAVLVFFEVLVGFIGIPSLLALAFLWQAQRFAKKDFLKLKHIIKNIE